MIEKGKYNIYDNKGNDRYIHSVRENVKRFHSLHASDFFYLAISESLGKDETFGEDNFPNVVAIYEGVKLLSTNNSPILVTQNTNPFGYIQSSSVTVLLSMDFFHDLTFEANKNNELAGRSWIPQVGDIVISTLYEKIFLVNEVTTEETSQILGDRSAFTITLVPYTVRNLNDSSVDLADIDVIENSDSIKNALTGIFGTTQVNNSTGEVEDIDKISNRQDVKKEIYELSDGVVVSRSRESLLGEF